MPVCKIDKANNQDIVNMYINGVTYNEIALKYNVSVSGIQSRLKTLGCSKLRNPGWSEDDLRFLKENYKSMEWDQLVKHFNKTKGTIIAKACEIGVKREIFFWSDLDIKILTDNYNDHSIRFICEMLNNKFSETAITTKAYTLKITSDRWSDYEVQTLKSVYENTPMTEVMKLIPNRSRTNIRAKAKNLKLKAVNFYRDAEIDYITNNWKHMTDAEIAEELGRNESGVASKRRLLGISRYDDASGYYYLREYIHGKNMDWRKRSIVKCNYTCALSGGRFEDVHHLYGANLIIGESLKNLGIEEKRDAREYSDEELNLILAEFLKIQDTHPLGICLSHEIHKKFHTAYGFGNNTPVQFEEFYQNYSNIA